MADMTNGDLAKRLVNRAKEYVQQEGGVGLAQYRNRHMHDARTTVDEQLARAIVSDFVNWVMYHQGMDLALRASDLADPVEK
jgi:hypothetical protein